MSAATDAPTSAGRERAALVVGPSSSTPRLVAFVLALLGTAGFCGLLFYNGVQGGTWVDATRVCLGRVVGQSLAVEAVTGDVGLEACRAPIEGTRGWYALGAIALVVLGAAVAAALVPSWVERRRRLKVPGERLAPAVSRVAELAREAGVTPPRVVLGSSRQRDAFTYGMPGAYRVVLPPALAVRPGSPAFDAAVRHEIQHLAHRDVALAWSLRGTAFVLGVLFLPAALVGTGLDPGFLGDVIWRAALLAVVVWLALSAWLRAREHDADLRAARVAGSPDGLVSTLSTLAGRREPPAGRVRAWWGGVRANHPTPAARAEILQHPDRLPVTGLVDGLTLGFTAALTLPLLDLVVGPVLSGRGRIDLLSLVTAVLVGPVVGATLGLGLWHHAALRRTSGRPAAGIPVALGVLVGALAGQAASPAGSGLGGLGGLEHPGTALLLAGGLAGATALLAGLGELWAAHGRSASVARWLLAGVLGAGLVTATLWAASVLQILVDLAGYPITALAALLYLPGTLVALLALVLALAALVGVGRGSGAAAAWRVLGLGAAAGAVGAAAILVFRLTQGPVGGDAAEARFYAYLAMTAVTAAAAGLVVQVLGGPAGAGKALACAMVSAIVTGAGFLALNTGLGGALTASFSWLFLRPALGLTLTLLTGAAFVGVLVGGLWRPARTAPTRTVALVVIAGSALASGGTLVAREHVVPALSSASFAPGPTPGPPSTPQQQILDYYKRNVAPLMASAYGDVLRLTNQTLQDGTSGDAEKADALRRTFLPQLRTLLDQAQTFQGDGPEVVRINGHLVSSLRAEVAAFESEATALETGDAQTFEAARKADVLATQEHQTWTTMLR